MLSAVKWRKHSLIFDKVILGALKELWHTRITT